jgi:hypothetical protein
VAGKKDWSFGRLGAISPNFPTYGSDNRERERQTERERDREKNRERGASEIDSTM